MYTKLPDGEPCLMRTNQHWIIFALPTLVALAGIALWCFLPQYYYVGLSVLGIGAIWFFLDWLRYITTEFVVTDKRIILKKGILTREALELMVHKCEGILVTQSIWGRLLNYGTITVTTGEVSNTYTLVSKPLQFRDAINKATQ